MALDRERLDAALAAHEPRLRALVLKHCRPDSGVDPDDVVQEVRIRLWRALESEKGVEHPASYIQRAAMSALIDAVRRRKARREEALEADEHAVIGVSAAPSPERVADREQRLHAVTRAIAQLPERRRVPAQLLAQGFSTVEIGRMLGMSEATARNLAYRGLEELGQALGGDALEAWDE